jgi:hypothetical protein
MRIAKELYKKHIMGEVSNSCTLYQEYAALTNEEIINFIDIAIADDSMQADEKIDVFLYLALFAYECGDKLPVKFYNYLLEQKVYYYSELYLRADENIAKNLIQCISDEAESLEINHILSCIAQIPCKTSLEFLQNNSTQSIPKWAEQLHILPIEYAKTGGWYPDGRGGIQQLFSNKVIAFQRCEKGQISDSSHLKPLEDVCAYCHQPLTLVFDGKDKLATCLYCACYETLFMKQIGDQVKWHLHNTPSDFFKENFERFTNNDEEITQRFDYSIELSREHKKSTYTAHQFAEVPLTQIGGMPTGINEIDYPICPECEQLMKFVAQFDIGDVELYGDGIYYFFSCEKCGVHACNYDQS